MQRMCSQGVQADHARPQYACRGCQRQRRCLAGCAALIALHCALTVGTSAFVHETLSHCALVLRALSAFAQEFEPAQYGIVDLSKRSASTAGVDTSITGSSNSSSNPARSSRSSSRVGYLKVLTFSATAPQAVAEALADIQKEAQQSGGLAGLIVDLRDNPGGIVEAGVDIAQVRAGLFVVIACLREKEQRGLLALGLCTRACTSGTYGRHASAHVKPAHGLCM